MEFDAEQEIQVLITKAREIADSDSEKNELITGWETALEGALGLQGSHDIDQGIEGTKKLGALLSEVLRVVGEWERE